MVCVVLFFFFQAEDGIRDLTVTGVQTCALPISCTPRCWPRSLSAPGRSRAPRRKALSRDLSSVVRPCPQTRSEEHTSELQSQSNLVCRLLLEKKKKTHVLTIHGHAAVLEPSLALRV